MEILSRKNNTSVDFSDTNNKDKAEIIDMFELISKVFFLTKEERFRAGIYIGYEGRDWIDQAALILPPYDEEQVSP